MENASKALLIAGGVLIAIIIITMFIMMFNRMTNLQKEQEEQIKIEQLAAFNAEYEAYNKKIMYGTDVITLINKVEDNNLNAGSDDYKIILNIDLNGTQITSSSQLIGTYELTIFECKKIYYNDIGRVCKIEIKNK